MSGSWPRIRIIDHLGLTIFEKNTIIIRLFVHSKIYPSFIHALYGNKRSIGFLKAKIIDGMLINSVQGLEE